MAMLKKAILTKASYSDEVTERENRNLEIAYKAATEAIVMLKNENNTLPFKEAKVALYGNGATMTIKGGTGSGEVNERHSVSIFEGFENREIEITNKELNLNYMKYYEEKNEEYIKTQRKRLYTHPTKLIEIIFDSFKAPEFLEITDEEIESNGTDNAIYVLSRQAGEGGDRRAIEGDMFVTQKEKEDIKKLASKYENFVLVINVGSQMDMSFIDDIEGIGAILYICQLGTQGGNALADVVMGKVSPSGKLADTWAMKYADIPFGDEYSYLDGNVKDEYYKEGIYVGYRYFDTFNKEVRFPFGFGLSYTEFELANVVVTNLKSKIIVNVDVKNIGEVAGKEVVQIYATAPVGTIDKEYQRLVAFAKTKELQKDETQTVTLELNMEDIASYDEKRANFVLESGDYIIRLGNSSKNTTPCAVVNIKEEVIVSAHDNILPKVAEFEELKSQREDEVVEDVTKINLTTEDFNTKVHKYPKIEECMDKKVQEILNKLTIKEMGDVIVGAGMTSDNTFDLPGSVGNTTSKYWDRGLVNVAMCDGPAGIRLQRRSGITAEGKIKPIDSALGLVSVVLPEFIKKKMNADPEKDTVIYQYTTAFPVSTAVAQTWNVELANEIGHAVYEEMKEYGCTYWLAPAVNIHRNPLCGRNFEYYSEDPFLAGKMVASMTKGVQSEKGFYVTVKHFACNNQEDNRNKMTSHLSERALREIYLPAFKMAVEEGNAKSIMTAYNKINGTYCANSYDLCTKVLRNEWGFDGVVMTDWFASMQGNVDDALCMSAGNDLIMPGGKSFKKKVLKGLKKKKITEEDIRISASHIIKSVVDSQIHREYMEKEETKNEE